MSTILSPQDPPLLADSPHDPAWRQAWSQTLRHEVAHNILPWWRQAIFDDSGRILGGRDNAGVALDVPRSAVLGTRLLWTFSSAQTRLAPDPQTAEAAHRSWDWLRQRLIDPQHGGVFWSVDAVGQPVADHKQVYAQAFAIYALTAYHRLCCRERGVLETSSTPALQLAIQLFELLDHYARDPDLGGYFEGCTRSWKVLPGAKLSDFEPPAPKSTNTLLHVLEAYTELLRCHRSHRLSLRLRELVEIFLKHLWQPRQACFGLFFDREWHNLTPQVSWGHDIEAAWLLNRACEVLGDAVLSERVQAIGLRVADAVLSKGVAADGSLLGAGTFAGEITDPRRHWWCQAEAMVGFWDTWELNGQTRHAQAAWANWTYIAQHHVDRQGGDWFKTLDPEGHPVAEVPKAGPWECPYHHARACFEMIERLDRLKSPE
jgi:cellobiose epimerase